MKSCASMVLTLSNPFIQDFPREWGPYIYEDIEDVVSVALGKTLENEFSTYDDTKQSIRVSFYCIAEHVALDVPKHGWYKARKMEECFEQDRLEEKPERLVLAGSAAKGVDSKKATKQANDLEIVLKTLPDDQRRIVMADAICRDGNASNGFLADELGIPAAATSAFTEEEPMQRSGKEMKKLGHDIPEPTRDKP